METWLQKVIRHNGIVIRPMSLSFRPNLCKLAIVGAKTDIGPVGIIWIRIRQNRLLILLWLLLLSSYSCTCTPTKAIGVGFYSGCSTAMRTNNYFYNKDLSCLDWLEKKAKLRITLITIFLPATYVFYSPTMPANLITGRTIGAIF